MSANVKAAKATQKVRVTIWDTVRLFVQANEDVFELDFRNRVLGACRARDSIKLVDVVCSAPALQMNQCRFAYFAHAQLMALVKKYPFSTGMTDAMRLSNAKRKFWQSERMCRRSNRRLRHYLRHPLRNPHCEVMTRARDLISGLIGWEPNLDEVGSGAKFGPGQALCSADNEQTTLYYKIADGVSVTEEALPYARYVLLRSGPLQRHYARVAGSTGEGRIRIVTGNRVTFVPKDVSTYRTIAIEPHWNLFLQLGVDRVFRHRLKKVGVDLDDQVPNQTAAKIGSAWHGSWGSRPCTIDLSSASDTVSMGIVEYLLPPAWVALLDDLRSKSFELDGQVYQYEKWSSMGNGYTFALESLIFWALGRACIEHVNGDSEYHRTYGDDIIVPASSAALLIEVLRFCGFRTNVQKTFLTGPFRESCGSDWWDGDRVRPIYLKEKVESVEHVYGLLNRLRLANGRGGLNLTPLYLAILRGVPGHLKLFGPPSESLDGWIHAPVCRSTSKTWDPDLSAYVYEYRERQVRPRIFEEPGEEIQYLIFLNGALGGAVHRRDVNRVRIRSRSTTVWFDDGLGLLGRG